MHIKKALFLLGLSAVLAACGANPLVCVVDCNATETTSPLVIEMEEAEVSAAQDLADGVYQISHDSEIYHRISIDSALISGFFGIAVVKGDHGHLYRVCLVEYDVPQAHNCQEAHFLSEQMQFNFISIEDELNVLVHFIRVNTSDSDTVVEQNWLISYTVSERELFQWGDELDLQRK